nr:hypothetical protein [uncultured Cohaesibacter sp.]
MSSRLKSIKDLSVLILAPRKHDRQLWADLLKNCDIRNPISMADIEQAAIPIGSGQVDVVFVDEAYGPQGIANILIPARNVEFAGGRGVCLILCSKKATAQDVLNARKLGFASLVILPASIGTVQKHLELAARYIPKSDEELGWSAPKIQEHRQATARHAPKADPAQTAPSQTTDAKMPQSAPEQPKAVADTPPQVASSPSDALSAAQRAMADSQKAELSKSSNVPTTPNSVQGTVKRSSPHSDLDPMSAPGRTATVADEDVVFL